MQTILDLSNVSKQYGTDGYAVKVLQNISFSVDEGEFISIMGASGSGKSTLLNIIGTVDIATEGCVVISRQNIVNLSDKDFADFRRGNLGFVFQDYNLLDTLTLRENIALALIIQNRAKNTVDGIINNLADKLGISKVLDKFPYEVSGGQRQRCACARAVAVEPRLILADEPTGALDSASAQNLMEIFTQINEEMGVTVLMVTHDAFSACYSGRILFMRDGSIVSELNKNGMDNGAFLRLILDNLARVSGSGENVPTSVLHSAQINSGGGENVY